MAASFRIRSALPSDEAAVSEVLLAAGLAAWSEWLGEERIRGANSGRVHPANLVAEDDDGVFAFVAWEVATGEITRLYTHPRGQRRGAAAALLARACEEMRAAGQADIWLRSEERNLGARRFYEKEGWRVEGRPLVREWHGTRLVESRFVKRQ